MIQLAQADPELQALVKELRMEKYLSVLEDNDMTTLDALANTDYNLLEGIKRAPAAALVNKAKAKLGSSALLKCMLRRPCRPPRTDPSPAPHDFNPGTLAGRFLNLTRCGRVCGWRLPRVGDNAIFRGAFCCL